jgi:coproporphyrinogen III oxidase
MKLEVQSQIKQLQERISSAFEACDGTAKFFHDDWQHHSGGGGQARVIQNGAVFEKGGVNFSAVNGVLPANMATRMNLSGEPSFFATGVSVVMHPQNPFVPAVHCNFRYFECYDEAGNVADFWFGGGADLTPCYPYLEDAQHFHATFKTACDPFGMDLYPKYKTQCDNYFFLPHRQETRGVGGIFFDYLRGDFAQNFAFLQAVANAFLEAYLPIVERRKTQPFHNFEREWQEIRRGRYAEFNLAFDRGTQFGLATNGRTESILMSLPPVTRWVYNHTPEPDSREAQLTAFLKARDWLGLEAG